MKKRILALLTAVMIASLTVLPVLADNYTPITGADTPTTPFTVDLTEVVFNKYLVVTGDVDVPESSFEYEVTKPVGDPTTGIYIPSDATHPVVYAGTGDVVVSADATGTNKDKLTFDSDDTPTAGPLNLENDTDVIGSTTAGSWGSAGDIKIRNDQKYVYKPITLDFSAAEFKEPGVYRYWLEEIPGEENPSFLDNDTTVENDGNKMWRTIDIYVEDDEIDNADNLTQSYTGISPTSADNGIMGTGGNDPDAEKKLVVTAIVMYEGKLEADKAPTMGDFTFDITNNSTDPLPVVGTDVEANVDPQSTSDDIVGSTWTDGTYDYKWNATDKKWDVFETGTTTPADPAQVEEDEVPDAATSASIAGSTFKAVYDAKYAAQLQAYRNKRQENGVEAGEKNGTFVNEYESHNLIVNKTVKGNQGSRDKYFKFTIEITDAGKGTVLQILRQKHDLDTSVNSATDTAYTKLIMDAANTRDDNKALPDGYQVITGGFDIQKYTWADGTTTYKYDKGTTTPATPDTWTYNGNTYPTEQDAKDAADQAQSAAPGTGDYSGITKVDGTPEHTTGAGWKKYENGAGPVDATEADIPDTATTKLGAYENTDINITLADAKALPETTDAAATIEVYLQHGEEIEIKGLPKGAKYTVTEVDADTDGYTSTIDTDPIKEETSTDGKKEFKGESGKTYYKDDNGMYYYNGTAMVSFDTASKYAYDQATDTYSKDPAGTYYKLDDDTYELVDTVDAARYSLEVTVAYTNEKKGVVPTGVLLSVTGGAVMVLLAGAYFVLRRRNEEEEYY